MVPALPATANLSSCALIEADESAAATQPATRGQNCSTVHQGKIAQARRNTPSRAPALLKEALEGLCDTCLLFGSPFAAARLNVDDLYLSSEGWGDVIQTRDGVAIDRDSEKAKDRLKYDFEVVPASASFDLRIVLENATPQDLQLISVGLSEFVHSFGVIGGKRSRGLGVSKLDDLRIFALELEGDDQAKRYANLRHYLIDSEFFGEEISGQEFLEKHIESIFG
jgi:CRISPR/Cas system CSM-associated protein Csm3 (group 7 of RAMP superfamily)